MAPRFMAVSLGVLLLAAGGCKGPAPAAHTKTKALADVSDLMTYVLSLEYPLDDGFVRQVMEAIKQQGRSGMTREAVEEEVRRIVAMQVAVQVHQRPAVYCRFVRKRLPGDAWAIKRDSAEIGTYEGAAGKIGVEVHGVKGQLTYKIEPEVAGKLGQQHLEHGSSPYDVSALTFWVYYRVHLGGVCPGGALRKEHYRVSGAN